MGPKPVRLRKLGHRRVQREDHVKTQKTHVKSSLSQEEKPQNKPILLTSHVES